MGKEVGESKHSSVALQKMTDKLNRWVAEEGLALYPNHIRAVYAAKHFEGEIRGARGENMKENYRGNIYFNARECQFRIAHNGMLPYWDKVPIDVTDYEYRRQRRARVENQLKDIEIKVYLREEGALESTATLAKICRKLGYEDMYSQAVDLLRYARVHPPATETTKTKRGKPKDDSSKKTAGSDDSTE